MADAKKRTVYVLRSCLDPERHYVGLTGNLQKRVESHNAGQSRDTARHKPWRLVVALEFSTDAAAIRFERYLKSGSGRVFAKRHLQPLATDVE